MERAGKIFRKIGKTLKWIRPTLIELILVFVLCTNISDELKRWKDVSHEQIENVDDYTAIQSTENSKDVCIIGDSRDISATTQDICGKYIISTKTNGWHKYISPYYAGIGYKVYMAKYEVEVYDAEKGELVETVDVKKLLEPYSDRYEPYGRKRVDYVYIRENSKGEILIYVLLDELGTAYMEQINKILENHEKTFDIFHPYLCYNLNTKHSSIVELGGEPLSNTRIDKWIQSWGIFYLSDGIFCTNNGFSEEENSEMDFYLYCGQQGTPGTARVVIPTSALPEHNKELYKRYPGLKEYRNQKGKEVLFFLHDYIEPKDFFPLLVDDRDGVSFDGLVLNEDQAKDGQVHEINSFEDYDQYAKEEERKSLCK